MNEEDRIYTATTQVLDDPDAPRETVMGALLILSAWHAGNHHDGCTCRMADAIEQFKFDLMVWRGDLPRLVGEQRKHAQERLWRAITGKVSA